MLKKILLSSTLLLLITIYILLNHTNLIASPTYTLNDRMEIIIDGKSISYDLEPIIKDKIYLNLDILKNELGIDILWDSKNKTAVIFEGGRITRIYGETNEIKINIEKRQMGNYIYIKNGQPFFAIDLIKGWKDYNYVFVKDTNKLIFDKTQSIIRNGKVTETIRVRSDKSIWSEVEDILKSEDIVHVYKEGKEWSYVRTPKGYFGYIRNDDLIKGNEIVYDKEQTPKVEDRSENVEKLNITWEYIYRNTPSVDKLKKVNGLDVISPTWFSLKNENGDIKDKGSIDYVKWAHDNSYKVWGLFNNSFDPDLTGIIINDSKLRERVINKIVNLALDYNLDGINIDFENVYLRDRDMFTQFIKELSPIAKEKKLTLSIDVTKKSLSENWSLFYDRKSIGKLVDYVILMAYDEHWASGGISGSVASIPWVENGIETLLEDVNKEKVILGVPFYTRVWKEEYINGDLKVKSFAVSMKRAKELLDNNNAIITWDNKAGQYYGEYKKDNIIYKVWLEDENSMEKRVDLVNKYNLSGIASWRRGFEEEIIWDIIKEGLNKN